MQGIVPSSPLSSQSFPVDVTDRAVRSLNAQMMSPSPKQSPSFEIVEQGIIQSAQDIGHLQIVDWNRTNGYWDNNPVRAMGIIDRWLGKRVGYTLVKVDMQKFPDRSDFPGWGHTGSGHNQVGKFFWNAFHAMQIGELKLTDSPDIEGTLFIDGYRNVPFLGDIGQVSVNTFIFSIIRLNAGDLWISVPDAHHQVILEPLVNLKDEWEEVKTPQKPMEILQKTPPRKKKKKSKYFDKEMLSQQGLVQPLLL